MGIWAGFFARCRGTHLLHLSGPEHFVYWWRGYHDRYLRVGPGQNGQILFISVEQLSLNVAGDSAKTLSVLENMGGVLDDCLLRFAQKCRRRPQNTLVLGVQRIFQNITEKGPLQKSYQIDELRSQTLQSHVSYTYLPSALEIPN